MDEAGLKLSPGSNERATLVPMIHPVLSTSCGSEASPPHVPVRGSKPSTTHSSLLPIKGRIGLVPNSTLGLNFERASLIGRALPHKEISVLYRRPPRMDEAGLKLSSGSNEQVTLVPMIHPILSTSCGSEAQPTSCSIHEIQAIFLIHRSESKGKTGSPLSEAEFRAGKFNGTGTSALGDLRLISSASQNGRSRFKAFLQVKRTSDSRSNDSP
ncbi:hypothetical protein FCV25MIE_19445, partial [Fagus crenata]